MTFENVEKIALLKAYDKAFETIFMNYHVSKNSDAFVNQYLMLNDTYNNAKKLMKII